MEAQIQGNLDKWWLSWWQQLRGVHTLFQALEKSPNIPPSPLISVDRHLYSPEVAAVDSFDLS
jgi:hypothetical protein